jgi:2-octaprenyl-6-methoxyphenol hydroxylase
MDARQAPRIAIVGAGPVGLALALLAADLLPRARLTLHDARSAEHDVSADPRVLALALGSVQTLQRLGAWPAHRAAPLRSVHVSQAPPSWDAQAAVRIGADELGLPLLGAVLSYGHLVAALQQAWAARVQAEPGRLASRFGTPVQALKPVPGGVEVDAGTADLYDLAVVAEGGVFAEQARKAVTHDYEQTAWVGTVERTDAPAGVAFERFTRQGPVALLPLPEPEPWHEAGPATSRAALVWCVPSADDPVRALDQAQRCALLNTLLPTEAGRVTGLSPLKHFALGLNAERTLVQGRVVRIGNAAQTLHPVAGQGLNLGLRDAHALVQALRRGRGDIDAALRAVEWQRAPDRWAMIATTDLLARGFTWRWPGVGAARGLALAALQALPPLKTALARHLMFGRR